MATWSVESELMALAGVSHLGTALAALGMINASDGHFEVNVIADWYRAGTETYLLVFRVRQGESVESYVMKACVSMGGSLSSKLSEWLERRSQLKELGVRTPELYARGPALLVEEYIPSTFAGALLQANASTKVTLLAEAGRTGGLLTGAGFSVLSRHDWRSRGDDTVVVDFGFDLGSLGQAPVQSGVALSRILTYVTDAGAELTPLETRTVQESFQDALRRVS